MKTNEYKFLLVLIRFNSCHSMTLILFEERRLTGSGDDKSINSE